MSDYEVTLVNDNSEFTATSSVLNEATDAHISQCIQEPHNLPEDDTETFPRQEFYVRFKGPDESTQHRPYNPISANH